MPFFVFGRTTADGVGNSVGNGGGVTRTASSYNTHHHHRADEDNEQSESGGQSSHPPPKPTSHSYSHSLSPSHSIGGAHDDDGDDSHGHHRSGRHDAHGHGHGHGHGHRHGHGHNHSHGSRIQPSSDPSSSNPSPTEANGQNGPPTQPSRGRTDQRLQEPGVGPRCPEGPISPTRSAKGRASPGHSTRSAGELAEPAAKGLSHSERKLRIALILVGVFFVVELVAGFLSGSLAILSDAFHLLSDIAGFSISLAAIHIVKQPATSKHSYGFARVEILGAIMSTALIWILTAYLVWEAIHRLADPTPIDAPMMLGTAIVGVIVNIVLAGALHGDGHNHSHGGSSGHAHAHGNSGHGHGQADSNRRSEGHNHGGHNHGSPHSHEHDLEHGHGEHELLLGDHGSKEPWTVKKMWETIEKMDMNVRSAAIHVVGDLLSSIGVVIAALVILIKPSWTFVDPICTFLFSILVVWTTFSLMGNSLMILMEATPVHIDPTQVEAALLEIPSVEGVHDLHIWSLTQSHVSMSVHLSISPLSKVSKIIQYGQVTGAEAEHSQERGGHAHHREHDDADHDHDDDSDVTTRRDTEAVVRITTLDDYAQILARAQQTLCDNFGIHHATIQLDPIRRMAAATSDSDEEDPRGRFFHDHCEPNMCQKL